MSALRLTKNRRTDMKRPMTLRMPEKLARRVDAAVLAQAGTLGRVGLKMFRLSLNRWVVEAVEQRLAREAAAAAKAAEKEERLRIEAEAPSEVTPVVAVPNGSGGSGLKEPAAPEIEERASPRTWLSELERIRKMDPAPGAAEFRRLIGEAIRTVKFPRNFLNMRLTDQAAWLSEHIPLEAEEWF